MRKKHSPLLDSVINDKLEITFAIDDKRKVHSIMDAMNDQAKILNCRVYSGCGYNSNISFPKDSKAPGARIQISSKIDSVSDGRLSFNPAIIGEFGIAFIAVFLRDLLKDQYNNIRLGKVTRLDIAANFSNVKVDDIFVDQKQCRFTGIFTSEERGTESIYLNRQRGNYQLVIYDKKAWANKYGYKEPPYELTRFEARIKKGFIFNTISELTNPFPRLSVYKATEVIRNNRMPICFLDSIRYRGFTGALYLLGKEDRRKTLDLIRSAKCSWISAEAIWDMWKRSLPEFDHLLCP